MLNFDVTAFLLCFARTAAWAQTAPVIGSGGGVPPKVRAGAALMIAIVIAPLRGDLSQTDLFLALPAEVLLGLIAGFTCRIALAGMESAGQLSGMLLGIGFGAFFDPTTGEEALPTRRIAYYLAALAFLSFGGLEASIRALAIAPAQAMDLSAMLSGLVDTGGTVLLTALRASAPLIVAAIVANLAVALASRAAPAMNAFSVMLALFLAVGGLVLYATAPAFMHEVLLTAQRAVPRL